MFNRFRKDKKRIPDSKSISSPKAPKTPTFQQEAVQTVTTVVRRDTSLSDTSLRLIQGKTNLSSFDPLLQSTPGGDVEARLKLRSKDRKADPMGLHVIYAPDNPQTIDIIFVHGLGGTSQQTWSKNRDPELFWPREWLPYEPDICTARVLSFGYNAHFSAVGANNMFNITDFAKELLFGMKFGMDNDSNLLEVGKVPIIFVAHSMGGLVVKKAYILGQNDVHYKDIVQSMASILFLSTPHRGTNLAEVLNKILTASVFNHSPKQYIAELKNNSPTLQEINEQFRHISSTMQIVSFFETMPTIIGPKKMMVLEKDSSILGYPGEISKPLTADHHDVCKYYSQQDSNYISVRDMLSSLVSRFRRKAALAIQESEDVIQDEFANVEKLLAISESPDEDYEFFSEKWMPGSCQWILEDVNFQNWVQSDSWTPQILWLRGLPGTGKSVMSSFIIGHLRELDLGCQFYFFRFGDQRKTPLNVFLKTLAYQVARDVPEYRQKLSKLADEGANIEKAESRIAWQKLFVTALFKMDLDKPLYWIIDALDECDSPTTLLNLFAAISAANVPIRILFVSRKNPSLQLSFDRLAASIPLETMEAQDSAQDLKLYVEKEMEFMRGSEEIKEHVANTVLEKAGGNFLWVRLVLEEIMQCHTEADIEQALTDLPADLEPLYARMEAALAKNSRPADQELAMTILTWAACARRALTLAELSQALTPEYKPALDLQHTINQTCGEFVLVDTKSNVNMVHQTARDYLIKTPGLRFSISPPEAHYQMFKKCVSHLMDKNPRARTEQASSQPFFLYAATSWPYHLHHSSAYTDQTSLIMLAKFFQGLTVLNWISALAQAKQLRVLVQASRRITTFLEKRARIDSEKSPTTHCIREKEIIESWATDLVKIIGKFGGNLVNQPKTIYKMIPSFCPQQSIIHKQFGPKNASSGLRVTGASNTAWDDSLAKFSVGRDCQPLNIVCLERFFTILTAEGTIILWNTETCEEIRRFSHGEQVLTFKFSNNAEKLATYGFRTTKIWNVASGSQLDSISNPEDTKALDMAFTADDNTLVTCSEDRVIRQFSMSMPDVDSGWEDLPSDSEFNAHYNSPSCVAFNADGTQVAVAYRSYPLSVWGVDYPGLIGRPESGTDSTWSGVERVCWNLVTGHVVGIYNDGKIFKWHPIDGETEEVKTVALEVQCSPDGNLIVTSDADGTLQIWSFHHVALIYQLSCTANVTDLAIDPLGRRIYDLRDSFCNIWEPNSLIRISEADEKASDSDSTIANSAHMSLAEVSTEMQEPVTALAVSSLTSSYCSGNDDGVVTLCKKNSTDNTELSQSYMTIDHIVFSADEKSIATADLSGRVSAYSLDLSPSKEPANEQVLSITIEDTIRQLLIHPQSTYLLISTCHSVSIYALSSNCPVTCSATIPFPSNTLRFAIHPSSPDTIIAYGYSTITLYSWSNFTKKIRTIQIDRPLPSASPQGTPDIRAPSALFSPRLSDEEVDRLWPSSDGALTLVQTSRAAGERRRRREWMLIRTSDISVSEASASESLKDGSSEGLSAMTLPPEVAKRIEMPLGFLGPDAIVGKSGWPGSGIHSIPGHHGHSKDGSATLTFLDREFWVCTGIVGGSSTPATINGNGTANTGNVKRHFFIPRDWLNMECLELAVMTKEGTLLVPRNGEVVAVKGGLREEWTA